MVLSRYLPGPGHRGDQHRRAGRRTLRDRRDRWRRQVSGEAVSPGDRPPARPGACPAADHRARRLALDAGRLGDGHVPGPGPVGGPRRDARRRVGRAAQFSIQPGPRRERGAGHPGRAERPPCEPERVRGRPLLRSRVGGPSARAVGGRRPGKHAAPDARADHRATATSYIVGAEHRHRRGRQPAQATRRSPTSSSSSARCRPARRRRRQTCRRHRPSPAASTSGPGAPRRASSSAVRCPACGPRIGSR